MRYLKRIPILFFCLFLLTACDNASVSNSGPLVTVYKSATCGCCKKWISHLQSNGFQVKAVDLTDMQPIKTRYSIRPEMASCHTAVVDGYVVEGHVPADLIKKLLKERPKVQGLSVPGMPMGSPGMEGPRKDPYNVIAFSKSGEWKIYAKR